MGLIETYLRNKILVLSGVGIGLDISIITLWFSYRSTLRGLSHRNDSI